MIVFLGWLMIGSSIFMAAFYLSVHQLKEDEEIEYDLDEEPSVAIFMPAYNEEDVVERAIKSALELDYENYEIILVDDGSTDSTLEEARKFSEHEKLTIIEQGENRGKAAALNTALENTDADYGVVQDADSSISPDTLKKALAKMESDSNLGGVIASIMPLRTNTFVRKLQVVEYRMTNFYRSLMSHIDTLDVTPGAFSIYRVSDLKEVGGFDEGNLTEDLEMAWRLRRHGRSISMVYDKKADTELPMNMRELFNQRVRWARGFMMNAYRYRDMFFNGKYGWFGVLQLPLQLVIPAVAVLSIVMISFGLVNSLFSYLVQVSAVGFAIPELALNLDRLLLNLQWKILFPLVSSLALGGYVIKTAYNESGKSVNHPLALSVYFFLYFGLQALFWLAAILKELFQTKRIWR